MDETITISMERALAEIRIALDTALMGERVLMINAGLDPWHVVDAAERERLIGAIARNVVQHLYASVARW